MDARRQEVTMRVRRKEQGLTVNVVAGSHVVFFGLDLTKANRPGFRGFAFKRRDHVEGDTIWLQGLKTFEKTEPHPAAGERFSTLRHPIQGFQWADYSVKPGVHYTYTVVALYGDPAQLERRAEVTVDVTTEAELGTPHSAFFNRGSVATQEYVRRFQNQPPSVAGPGAYEWLSRGLLEALVAFIGRAGAGWEIHGAVYEFQWAEALVALRAARDRGAQVTVLYDDIEAYTKDGKPKGPFLKNRDAIATTQIADITKGRKRGKLMHNKFFVLSKLGQPVAVWTGSTNLTENGIFGHANVGHVIEDPVIAQAYLDYWGRLDGDPPVKKPYRDQNETATPVPPVPWKRGTTVVFSPRGTELDALHWYAEIAKSAKSGLFMTFAFGMNQLFKDVYRRSDAVLRMALMEKPYSSPRTRARDERDIQLIRNRTNVVVAIGNRIVTNSFDRWLAELARLNPNVMVHWVHTKFMLVDPLGSDPIVATGSANFSDASTDTNDENMLVIRGDRRIADIYFGEYLRLYTHYAFREAVKFHVEEHDAEPERWEPQFLVDADSWWAPYFDPSDRNARYARRRYFAGPLSVG
jgi:phosphatidylserine/phosphatidylglycerophosphate/cardiolipin synthase-like enzyme